MLDSNTKFEIQNEVDIFCQDLRMLTLVTNRLFDPMIPYSHPDKHRRFTPVQGFSRAGREPDGYRADGRPCSR